MPVLEDVLKELKEMREDASVKTKASESLQKQVEGLKTDNEDTRKKMEAAVLEAKAAQTAVDSAMRLLAEPGRVPGNAGDKKGASVAKKAMEMYMRGSSIDQIVAEVPEAKALIVGSQADGGILVPSERANRIIELVSEVSPIRQEATVMRTSSNELEIPKETANLSAAWSDEQTTRSADTAAKLGLEKIPVHSQTVLQQVSRQLLSDSAIDIEAYVAAKVAKRMAVAEGTAFVSGNGVHRPQGITFGSLVTRVQSTTAAAGYVAPDDVLDTEANLISTFARTAKWVMHRLGLNWIRKFKDNENRFLNMVALDSLRLQAEGVRQMLLDGYPVVEAPDMSQPGVASADLGIFADLKELYTIVDRENMILIRDIFTNKATGLVDFLFERRVGGQVVNAAAGRIMRAKS